jgi:hypothetical protein
MRRSILAPWLVFVIALGAWALAPPSGAEETAADAKRAAELVARLSKALDELLADPGLAARQPTAMQQRELDAAIASARESLRLVKDLKRRLAGGYSVDDSRPFWDQIAALRQDISAYAGHSWLPESARVKAEAAGGLMDELASLYGEA